MKIHLAEAEVVSGGRTDIHTNRHDEANSRFSNFANAFKDHEVI